MNPIQCIWCRFFEPKISFHRVAHIVPKSLGGLAVCGRVCDSCNTYFGNRDNFGPAIELTLKETLSITRGSFLHGQKAIGIRKKNDKHFTSTLFKVDFEKRSIQPKRAYRTHRHFQETVSFQFRRGIYKMFLEALEHQTGSALESKYDFIREFARYGMGEYPVFYFIRSFGVILVLDSHIVNPELVLGVNRMKYLIESDYFIEFELLGHVFGIPTSKMSHLIRDQYLKETRELKKELFLGFVQVKYFTDVDLSLNLFRDGDGYPKWLSGQYGNRIVRF